MGGYTKWKILQDNEINETFPRTFGRIPEITPDILKDQIIEGWKRWDSDKWERLISKGVFE